MTQKVPQSMRVLLTYFGAFEGVPVNPTDRLAHAVHAHCEEHPEWAVEVILQELPVVFGESARRLNETIAAETPDAVIALGVAVGRNKVSLERVAINLDDARIADTEGIQRKDSPIVADAPAAYFSTLPTRAVVEKAQALNLPAELSYTAGTYVCNHVFYSLMHAVAGTTIPAGFIHVPALEFETKPQNQLVAHVDAGGVEGTAIPTISVEEAKQIITLAILEISER